jgi:hypothetical protein
MAKGAKGEKKAQVMHRPDWHPSISTLIGNQNIVDNYGYVTEQGTIHLLGPLYKSPNLSINTSKSDINGPTLIMSAESSLGF